MGRRIEVKPGERYGRLVIVGETEPRNGHRRFLCGCDCGSTRTVDITKLRNGHTRSCGCLSRESTIERSTTHGMHGCPLYGVWAAMKSRCANENVAEFDRYGGRGIQVCEEWAGDFAAFHAWAMASGYRKGLTLDRIDNDGDYRSGNCRWISPTDQANNRRSSRVLLCFGKALTLAQWGRETGIDQTVIWKRLARGWSAETALMTPRVGGGPCGH